MLEAFSEGWRQPHAGEKELDCGSTSAGSPIFLLVCLLDIGSQLGSESR